MQCLICCFCLSLIRACSFRYPNDLGLQLTACTVLYNMTIEGPSVEYCKTYLRLNDAAETAVRDALRNHGSTAVIARVVAELLYLVWGGPDPQANEETAAMPESTAEAYGFGMHISAFQP